MLSKKSQARLRKSFEFKSLIQNQQRSEHTYKKIGQSDDKQTKMNEIKRIMIMKEKKRKRRRS